MSRRIASQSKATPQASTSVWNRLLQRRDTSGGGRDAVPAYDLSSALTPRAARASRFGHDFSRVRVQAKLTVGEPDDAYEREADRIAEQVTRGLEHQSHVPAAEPFRAINQPVSDRLQSKPATDSIHTLDQSASIDQGLAVSDEMQQRILRSQGNGQRLPQSIQQSLEPHFSHRLGDVQIHTDGEAQEMTDALQARAFTLGRDIYFAPGSYAPESTAGRRLLVHELTHTIQQGAVNSPSVQRDRESSAKQKPPLKLKSVTFLKDQNLVVYTFENGTQVTQRARGKIDLPLGTDTINSKQVFYVGDQPVAPGTYERIVKLGKPKQKSAGADAPVTDVRLGTGGGGTGTVAPPPKKKPAIKKGGDAPPVIDTGSTGTKPPTKKAPAEDKPEITSDDPDVTGTGTDITAEKKQPAPTETGQSTGTGGQEQKKTDDQPPPDTSAPVTSPDDVKGNFIELPAELAAILSGKDKVEFKPEDKEKLQKISEKLKKLSVTDLAMFKSLATHLTHDLDSFDKSIDLYNTVKDEVTKQAKTQQAEQSELQKEMDKTWEGFDAEKFKTLTKDQKIALARKIQAQQVKAQLKHMATHPGETAKNMIEGVFKPDVQGMADDIKEALNGDKSGFARAAGAAGFVGKSTGYIGAVAGFLAVALMFVPGVNIAALAATALAFTAASIMASTVESELRIQAAGETKDPKEFQEQTNKSSAAATNALAQAAFLVVHLTVKLTARIPLKGSYANVGEAFKAARASLLKVTGVGQAFDALRTSLLTRLKGARAGLPEALAKEVKQLDAAASQIRGMTGPEMLDKIAAGDKALADLAEIPPDVAKSMQELAKTPQGQKAAETLRQQVLKALEDAPKQADKQVQGFLKQIDQATQAVEHAQTPEALKSAIDTVDKAFDPQQVSQKTLADDMSYVQERIESDIKQQAAAAEKAPPAPPDKPPTAPTPKPEGGAKAPAKTENQPPVVQDQPPPATGQQVPSATDPVPAGQENAPAQPSTTTESKPQKPPTKRQLAKQEAAKAEAAKADAAKAEAAKAAAAKATEMKARLSQLETERTTVVDELKKQRDKAKLLRDEINTQEAARKRAVDNENRAANADEKAKWRDEARKAKDAREEAKEKLEKVPSDDDLVKQREQLDKQIAALKVQLDPKTRAPLPCFAAGTRVWTASGPRAIDQLNKGDVILAFDAAQAKVVPCPISEAFTNRTTHFYDIQVGGQTIRATGRHPFWVEDQADWVAARDLRPSMRLKGLDGATLVVEAIELGEGFECPSYNLSIDATHNYFVGPGVLVHNGGAANLGFADNHAIYRGTNPKKPGVYVGQVAQKTSKGKLRGVAARQQEHRETAEQKLKDHYSGKKPLSSEDVEFYEFMKDVELEEIVNGVKSEDLASYLEQKNIDIERDVLGNKVMNRREEIKSEAHKKAVTERLMQDQEIAQYCPK